jgi:hypothetical protein
MQVNDINRFLTTGLSCAGPVWRHDYPMPALSQRHPGPDGFAATALSISSLTLGSSSLTDKRSWWIASTTISITSFLVQRCWWFRVRASAILFHPHEVQPVDAIRAGRQREHHRADSIVRRRFTLPERQRVARRPQIRRRRVGGNPACRETLPRFPLGAGDLPGEIHHRLRGVFVQPLGVHHPVRGTPGDLIGRTIALLSDLWSHRFEPPRRCAPPLLSQGGEILQLD